MKCKNVNPEESRKAIKESQKSLKTSKKAGLQKRIRFHMSYMEYQAADTLRQLRALRDEEEK